MSIHFSLACCYNTWTDKMKLPQFYTIMTKVLKYFNLTLGMEM